MLIDIDRGGERLPDVPCYVSVVTLYEFARGKMKPAAAKGLSEEICGVVPLDNYVVETTSEIWRSLRSRETPIDDRDLLIGASTISKGLPL